MGTMNSSTTTSSPGRWSPPATKVPAFLANSNSFGSYGAGEDITSQLERRDWQRKHLNGPVRKDTTSSPPDLWGASFSSYQQTSSNRSSFFGSSSSQFGSSQSSSRNSSRNSLS